MDREIEKAEIMLLTMLRDNSRVSQLDAIGAGEDLGMDSEAVLDAAERIGLIAEDVDGEQYWWLPPDRLARLRRGRSRTMPDGRRKVLMPESHAVLWKLCKRDMADCLSSGRDMPSELGRAIAFLDEAGVLDMQPLDGEGMPSER